MAQQTYPFLSRETLINPYPLYQRLRQEHPVHLDTTLGCWILTRYSDVVSTFAHPHISSERIKADRLREPAWEKLRPLFQAVSKQLLFLDPPDHTRLRTLMSKAFLPRLVDGMRPTIQRLIDSLLDDVRAAGRMDIIRDIAIPLPAIIIASMLGIPPEDHHKIRVWSNDFAVFLSNPTMLDKSKLALQSMQALMDYFQYQVAQRRQRPTDDLLSALIHAEEQGSVLDEEELLVNCVLLLFGGHETTTNLIGNGMFALMRHPEQKEKLLQDPSLIKTAIEELLRYDSPTQWTGRVAKKSLEIGGKKIYAGQGVILVLGAANRDPAQFLEPDRLDITRQENHHLAFGYSRHFCLGAALARLEGQITIQTILQRLPALQLASAALEWQDTPALRALTSLPVRF